MFQARFQPRVYYPEGGGYYRPAVGLLGGLRHDRRGGGDHGHSLVGRGDQAAHG